MREIGVVTRDSFVDTLGSVTDVSAHYAFIDHLAEQGGRDILGAMFGELHQAHRERIPDWAFGAVLERIVEALALNDGLDNAIAAFDFAAAIDVDVRRRHVRLRLPSIASKVADAHSPDVIDRLLLWLSDLESKALVLHEAVVRGKLVEGSVAVREVVNQLERAGHPLAWLPPALFGFEEPLANPHHAVAWKDAGGADHSAVELAGVTPPNLADRVETRETTRPERVDLMCAAVANWRDESNGKIEARTFFMELPGHVSWMRAIPRLGLESVQASDEFKVRDGCGLKGAFAELFSAASAGGAYNIGNFAAYGRLLAWRSLAGLVGLSADVPVRSIAAAARSCQWCILDSSSDWHYQVAWDMGIACFNSGERELAVLAATDTD